MIFHGFVRVKNPVNITCWLMELCEINPYVRIFLKYKNSAILYLTLIDLNWTWKREWTKTSVLLNCRKTWTSNTIHSRSHTPNRSSGPCGRRVNRVRIGLWPHLTLLSLNKYKIYLCFCLFLPHYSFWKYLSKNQHREFGILRLWD